MLPALRICSTVLHLRDGKFKTDSLSRENGKEVMHDEPTFSENAFCYTYEHHHNLNYEMFLMKSKYGMFNQNIASCDSPEFNSAQGENMA